MKKALFEELHESVREAGRIRRGEAKPLRVFHFTHTDVKTIRARLGKLQSQAALMIGISLSVLVREPRSTTDQSPDARR